MVPPTAVAIHTVTDTSDVTLSDPLTVGGVTKRRNAAGKLNCGVAAATSSDLFKGPVCLWQENEKKKTKKWSGNFC
jgi:aromatic amino acid aminotransferase I